jgi:hypothetical protein
MQSMPWLGYENLFHDSRMDTQTMTFVHRTSNVSRITPLAAVLACLLLANCSTIDMNQHPSTLNCPPLPAFDPSDWKAVSRAFEGAPEVQLKQSWLETPQIEFLPTRVRVGQRDDALWIFAVMDDADVHNPLRGHNEEFFLHGDVFEIFLRPLRQPAYFEFHVTPHNDHFQLRIPSARAFASPKLRGDSKLWKIVEPVIRSWTAVDKKRSRWLVLAAIPFDSVVEARGSRREWLFSFSRYDYTRGTEKPVLSSSSPHKELGFHRQQEWGRLRFGEQ